MFHVKHFKNEVLNIFKMHGIMKSLTEYIFHVTR